MMKMSCPECGLIVMLGHNERSSGEQCPRCLARSSGTLSVRLRRGAPPRRVSRERRVIEFLRKRAGHPLGV